MSRGRSEEEREGGEERVRIEWEGGCVEQQGNQEALKQCIESICKRKYTSQRYIYLKAKVHVHFERLHLICLLSLAAL